MRKPGVFLLIAAVAVAAVVTVRAHGKPHDRKPPTVAVTSPGPGATVAGTVTLAAGARDQVGVTEVTWFVDGREVARDSDGAPWTTSWDSATVADGAHQLIARAGDAAGNWGTSTTVSITVGNARAGRDPVIAAAGDIASIGSGDEATATLLDAIDPTAVLSIGDNAYENGTRAEFDTYYAPTWGRHKAITRPTPGNHEYQTPGAAGYFDYFGSRAGERGKGYYSYDLGAWHLIALNSEIPHDAGSPQVAWLKADLAASGAKCTLAYWHRPRFTAGRYGDDASYTPFWQALYDADADVVLAGHDHTYQRYEPLDPAGRADAARGIREFVVGTGGGSHYALRSDDRRVAGTDKAFGVLKLTLRPTSFDFEFVPVAGSTYSDTGTGIPCH